MSQSPVADRATAQARAARRAILTIFFANGVIVASWVAHVPLVKERFGLSESVLGLTLLAIAAGSVLSLAVAGAVIARLGSRLVTRATTLALCALLPSLLLVRSYPLLVGCLALFGMSQGAMDVAMNAQAVAVEGRYGRPIMSTFHALFSVGGLVGAAAAGLLLSAGLNAETHVIGVALVVGTAAAVALVWLLPTEVDRRPDEPTFVLPSGPVIGLGILAFCSMVGEGAMADWSAVYLRSWLHTDAGLAATGFAAFSLTMTAGRFFGDTLRTRLQAAPLLQISGGLAAVGLAAALLLNQPAAALVGFGCVGLGLSNVVPVVFSAAGRVPGSTTGMAIAAVATTGYFGFLAGPPLIGFVAQAATLPVGLGVVVAVTGLIAVLTRTRFALVA